VRVKASRPVGVLLDSWKVAVDARRLLIDGKESVPQIDAREDVDRDGIGRQEQRAGVEQLLGDAGSFWLQATNQPIPQKEPQRWSPLMCVQRRSTNQRTQLHVASEPAALVHVVKVVTDDVRNAVRLARVNGQVPWQNK
jgi:hypothetical protein